MHVEKAKTAESKRDAQRPMKINRYSVWWLNLDPVKGSEQRGRRPCVVVSPDEMNHNWRTVNVVPLTSKPKTYPTAVRIESTADKTGMVSFALVDQIRTVSIERFEKYIGDLESDEIEQIRQVISDLFLD